MKFLIDSDANPNWSCVLGPVAILGDIDALDELVQVSGHISSSAVESTDIVKPAMRFGGPLAPVQVIVDFLTAFGFPFPLSIEPTNWQAYAFKTGVKYKFPDYGFAHLDEALEEGLGVMLDVEIVAGFGKASKVKRQALGSESNPHGWHLFVEVESKLLGKAIELGIAKAFFGGAMKFEVGGTDEGYTEIKFAWGLSGAIEGEAGVLSFEGKRTYMAVFQRLVGKKEVGLGFSSEWGLEAEFLKGLAALAISFELMVLVERSAGDAEHPADHFKFKGKGTIAFDITLAWVATKTYEEEIELDERLAAAAFIAGTVLP